ncbi:TetR family transcriptional regulator [Streptomyces sp. CB02923]|uniref:TetR/AcrR family transcriptional regulator n=1 Tax=Streptomyces sp. CB02923 TaxID=1718985 RepID=UPI000939EC98|nr:TetR/AcrR family transcriptional regulator [Streptomyces sp. CB02923]OKI00301.1 TetR family transcriptional regulator [Streptomyces sp. CB02923]
MAEELGLRERKKRQTERRVWRTAVELFLERGFEKVSVQEIAAAADVSKMTVFNYYGSKEDLVLKPMEHHADDAARAVRERGPGESALAAVYRQFVELLEQRDPSVGLSDNSEVLNIRRLIVETPDLLLRAHASRMHGLRQLAEVLAQESDGDRMSAQVAAGQLMAARNALINENHRRLLAGESADAVYPDAVAAARRAFGLVERGLGDYALRPAE